MYSRNKYSLGILPDTIPYANLKKEEEKKQLEKLDLGEITMVDFPDTQYVRQQTKKKQIVLHHTVSAQGAQGDIGWWLQTSERIATHVVIDWKGKIFQCYSSLYWAWHIGTHGVSNPTALEKMSIGVELDAWGALIRHNRNWYPVKWDSNLGRGVPDLRFPPVQNVQTYPEGFRGFYGFEKYTDEQIESLRQLLVFWNERYGIPLGYNEDMWDLNNKSKTGTPGIWTHVNYRNDKSDCHPQPELIQMLKSLK